MGGFEALVADRVFLDQAIIVALHDGRAFYGVTMFRSLRSPMYISASQPTDIGSIA